MPSFYPYFFFFFSIGCKFVGGNLRKKCDLSMLSLLRALYPPFLSEVGYFGFCVPSDESKCLLGFSLLKEIYVLMGNFPTVN